MAAPEASEQARRRQQAARARQQRDAAAAEAIAAAAALIALYGWAQAALLGGIARIISGTPHTMAGYQGTVGRMRTLTRQVQATLQVRTAPLVHAALTAEATAGDLTAILDAQTVVGEAATTAATPGLPATTAGGTHLPPPPTTGGSVSIDEAEFFDLSKPHGERAAESIIGDLTSSLTNVRERLTRLPDDVYKAIAPHGGILSVLDNGLTLRQSQAAAWRVFLDQGVTGFVDKAGRRWNLASYVEMAVRTATVRAFNDSHIQRMRVLGVRYFQVPPHATACPLCWPWEGQVLSDGLQPDADHLGIVAGTLNDAIAAGLFHPNCRHTLVAWLPGISDTPTPRPIYSAEAERLYADTQRQRALERRVRKAREAEALALDGPERTAARKRVAQAQKAIRQHLDGKPHLSRAYSREQPNLGLSTVRLPAPAPQAPISG